MIISRTPYRVSLFGGGTDYPEWFNRHGGAVLGSSIDKYCYISCRYLPPFFTHKNRIAYSKIELTDDASTIQHPAVKAILQTLNINGVAISHDGDLPARSGIGSSSSFVVGLLSALHALSKRYVHGKQLALQAINIEREVLNEVVGFQDQIFAACGGFNLIEFRNDDFEIVPVRISPERQHLLQDHLMLYFTGTDRYSSTIAASYIQNMGTKEAEAKRTHQLVYEAMDLIIDGDISLLGELLHESWELKRQRGRGVSTEELDVLYQTARAAGAMGGKITGAGGAGFMLLFVRPECQGDVHRSLQALKPLVRVPFRFESGGSQIIANASYYD